MVLLTSCCCCSVRNGSLACGVYTMIFYTVVLTASSVHIYTVQETPVLLAFAVAMVTLSVANVTSSIFLIIGICLNNRVLLLPWIFSLALTTLLDIVLCVYFILDSVYDAFIAIIFITDILICALNMYCLLCVLSLYQSYCQQSSAQDMETGHQVHYMQSPGCVGGANRNNFLSVPKGSTMVTEDGHSTAVSSFPNSYQHRLSVSRSGLYPELRPISEEQRHQDSQQNNGYSECTLLPADSRCASPAKISPEEGTTEMTFPVPEQSSPTNQHSPLRRESSLNCGNDTQPLLAQHVTTEHSKVRTFL